MIQDQKNVIWYKYVLVGFLYTEKVILLLFLQNNTSTNPNLDDCFT